MASQYMGQERIAMHAHYREGSLCARNLKMCFRKGFAKKYPQPSMGEDSNQHLECAGLSRFQHLRRTHPNH
jgi:hypothetical protein